MYEGAGTGEGLIMYMCIDGMYVVLYVIESLCMIVGEFFGDEYVFELFRYFKKK